MQITDFRRLFVVRSEEEAPRFGLPQPRAVRRGFGAAVSHKVYINEHKIKVREGIGMMVKLGVKNLPTICIDGEVAFASIIPDQKSLVSAIEERVAAKS